MRSFKLVTLASGLVVATALFTGMLSAQVKNGVQEKNAIAATEPSLLAKRAIEAPQNSKEQAQALWELVEQGKEVKSPAFWGEQMPQSEFESMCSLKDARLFRVTDTLYVFYGESDGTGYLYLLSESSYLGAKLHFTTLTECVLTVNKNYPEMHFDEPSLWDQPVPESPMPDSPSH